MDWSAVKNPSKKEDTRRIIVEAAERLFSEVGFQKITLADIAHELHMSLADVFGFSKRGPKSTRRSDAAS
jgi:AcrR family transcriptional regulator